VVATIGRLPDSGNDLRARTARSAVGIYVGNSIKQRDGNISAATGSIRCGRIKRPVRAAFSLLVGCTNQQRELAFSGGACSVNPQNFRDWKFASEELHFVNAAEPGRITTQD